MRDQDGQSVASTMGFSALDGLPMETGAGSSTPPLCFISSTMKA